MRYLYVIFLMGLVSCGDSTQDKKVRTPKKTKNEKKTEIIIQPSCDKLGGMDDCQILGQFLEYDNYTGIIKCCENGRVMDFVTLKDGLENGLSRGWYENGQMEYEENYKEGVEDGLHREWHANGQLLSEGNYKDGVEDGLFREWSADGQLLSEENYKDGVLISEKCWDWDGNEVECIEIEEGCSH